jgi:hypothetical protein
MMIAGDNEELLALFMPTLLKLIAKLLLNDDVETCVQTMYAYNIKPEHIKEHLVQLQMNTTAAEAVINKIPSKTKASLTRMYNTLYKTSVGKAKKKKQAGKIRDKFDPDIEEPLPELSDDEEVVVEEEIKPAKTGPRKQRR